MATDAEAPRGDAEPTATTVRSPVSRAGLVAVGLLCVALGGIGVVVPGVPTTVFFIGAAACFARSSPRLERWVLDLPGVGRLVRDHREGLGMPRRAKIAACATIALFAGASVLLVIEQWVWRATVSAVALVGILWIVRRIPTTELVTDDRAGRR